MSTITGNDSQRFDVLIYFNNGQPRQQHEDVSAERAAELERQFEQGSHVERVDVLPHVGMAPEYSDRMRRAMGGALLAIYERLVYARREGDEWAAEFLTEEWPNLVPEEVRALLGIDDD